ncbi:MAG TPA: DUF4129 domain-containing protein [Leifsonia sp.]|jgi:hypothetical protein|nr:hypothetical protein [Microbacteriaceae bacterium]HEV7811541.1 DUF4129 domain-containing protein [Leifsonia sp.]
MIRAVPVDPEIDEAREWLLRELARPPYRAAEPSWFDRLASLFWDWLTNLLGSGIGASQSLIWGFVLLVLVAGLVAAYLVYGPPRRNRRSRVPGALFGNDDDRDAATIRSAAEGAAAAEEWPLAIEEMFRAIARGLAERAVLSTTPGTTASGFALRARDYFPALDRELRSSAAVFDDVRYLDRPGSAAQFAQVAGLERELRSRTPVLEDAG